MYLYLPLWHLVADKSEMNQFVRSCSSSTSSLENVAVEGVTQLQFQDSYAKKNDGATMPCLWVGTSLGSVLVIHIHMPELRNTQPIIVSPAGTLFRLRGEIKCIGFLNSHGSILNTPSEKWEEGVATSGSKSTNRTKTESGGGSSSGPSSPPIIASTSAISPTGGSGSSADRQLVLICSEKHARVIGLPSQLCLYKAKITETSQVLKADVIHLRNQPLLVVFLRNSHVLCLSLPSLRLLLDINDGIPQPCHGSFDTRFLHCFAFAHNAQAVYACSPTEIEKITFSSELSSNLKDMQGDLFVVAEMPASPKKNFIQNIFSGVASSSSLDRNELFGESTSGKASASVATLSSNAKMEKAQSSAGAATSEIGRAKQAAIERGERLGQLDKQTQEMLDQAKSFGRNASLLAKKYEKKDSWWPF